MQYKIISLIPTSDEEKNNFIKLADAYKSKIDFCELDKITDEVLSEYDIVLGSPSVDVLKKTHKLKYLHLAMAGSNAYVKNGVLKEGVLLTNSTGAFGHAISEHMMGMLFEIYKKLHFYRDNQNDCNWHDEGSVRSIYGAKCLMVGMGDIGSAFAKSAAALGMRVSGMRRTTTEKPDYVEKMYPFGSLNEIIGDFDIVALALPETPDTVKIINRENIALMKDGAVILNVGRGSAIDTDALLEALQCGKLSGAGIDVTEPEPLPPEHPLWKCKNVVITPHVSGYFHLRETYENILKLAYENLEAFLSGKEPKNIVDFETGYRRI